MSILNCDAVDDILQPSNRVVQPSNRRFTRSHFGNPALPIPMMYAAAANPYSMGFYSQQQPNFPLWPYPNFYKPTSSLPDDDDHFAATSPDSRQQSIPCGVGPDSPPQRQTPTVSIVGGTEAIPNSWLFIVSFFCEKRQSFKYYFINHFYLYVYRWD